MWEMPFYDIMMLYNAYAAYCDEENAKSEEEQERYRADMDAQREQMNMNNIKAQMPKMPDMTSLSRGFTNGSGFKF